MASHTDIIRKFDTIIQSMRAGGVNNPIDYIEQISYFLFLKLLDEREEQAEQIAKLTKKAYDGVFAGDNEKYRFRNWAHSLNGDELRLFIESDIFPFIRNLKSLRPEEREYFRNAHLKIYEPSTLKGVVENIASMDFSSLDTIDKGDLYEHMLSQISKSGKNGQFRTPRHIIDMMTSIVDPDIMETVYDPSVGTAGFIISAFQHILKKYSDPATMKHKTDDRGVDYTLGTGDKLTETQSSFLYQKTFYGYDIDAHMVRFSIMNMILHGFTEGTNIRIKDTLGKNTDEQDKARQYDIILANPPFSGTIDRSRIDSDDFPVASNSTEVLFLGHMIDKLRDGGRAAVIVPEGVLFKTNKDYQGIRKYLITKCNLQAVISLPSGVFNPYAGVKTNILVFQKGGKTDKVWFYDMQADGYDLGAQRRPIKETDIPDILHRWKQIKQAEQPENERSWCATKEEIEKNEWVLSAGKYHTQIGAKKNIQYTLFKLGDICNVLSGGTPSKEVNEYWENGDIPRITSSSCKDKVISQIDTYITKEGLKNSSAKVLQPNTTLVAMVGATIGKTGFLTVPSATNQNVAGLYPKDTSVLLPHFLYYIMQSKYDVFVRLGDGGYKMANLSFIRDLEIPLPPLDVQQELVNKLNAQQAIIDSIDTLITQLEEAGIDESLFDGIDERVELGEVCDVRDGTHDSPTYQYEGIPLITSKNISKGYINFDDVKFISLDDHKKISLRSEVTIGDILMPMIGTIGGPVIVETDREFSVKNVALFKMGGNDLLDANYLKIVLSSKIISEQIKANIQGGTQKFIGLGQIRRLKIPLPSKERQHNISDIQKQQDTLLENLTKYKKERKRMIKDILSGLFDDESK